MIRMSVLIISFSLFYSFCIGQENREEQSLPNSTVGTSGDTLAGVKYFIRIGMPDSGVTDNMPVYRGEGKPTFTFVDKQPVPVRTVSPVHPRINHEGEVTIWVRCLIGTDGKVQKAVVMQSNNRFFEKPAVDAALQWIFHPALKNGEPIAVWGAIPIRFPVKH